jgi:hypothetical protein
MVGVPTIWSLGETEGRPLRRAHSIMLEANHRAFAITVTAVGYLASCLHATGQTKEGQAELLVPTVRLTCPRRTPSSRSSNTYVPVGGPELDESEKKPRVVPSRVPISRSRSFSPE